MKSVGVVGTAAIVLALATPAGAVTTTWTVDPGGGPCNSGNRTCGSIQAAQAQAAADDIIDIKPKAGGWDGGVSFNQAGITIRGSGGEVRVNGTLSFTGTGTGTFFIQDLAILSTGGPALTFTSNGAAGDKTVEIQSSILSGSGPPNAAISATTGLLSTGAIDITGRHVTLNDSASAPATAFTPDGMVTGGTIAATFNDSIVRGSKASGTTVASCDLSQSDSAIFVAPNAEDFHLRNDSPAINQGGIQQGNEVTNDVEGEARTGAWECGADEWFNHPPNAPVLSVTPNPVATNQAVTFGATTADPDFGRGDQPRAYHWNFGDGSPMPETLAVSPTVGFSGHVYSAPGTYVATVTAVDESNLESPTSNSVNVIVTAAGSGSGGGGGGGAGGGRPTGPDLLPPTLSITSPRPAQRLKRGRRAPVLRGRTSDATGVRTVELALRRFEPRGRCRWYDARRRAFLLGACATPRFFRAVVNDFGWSFTFPRTVNPGLGRYELRARATDFLGHRTTAFTAAARTLVGFRIVR